MSGDLPRLLRVRCTAGNSHERELVCRAADEVERLQAENERLRVALNYVTDMTYLGADAKWHFKPGYDPEKVLDALVTPIAAGG